MQGPKRKYFFLLQRTISSEQLRKLEKIKPFGHCKASKIKNATFCSFSPSWGKWPICTCNWWTNHKKKIIFGLPPRRRNMYCITVSVVNSRSPLLFMLKVIGCWLRQKHAIILFRNSHIPHICLFSCQHICQQNQSFKRSFGCFVFMWWCICSLSQSLWDLYANTGCDKYPL